MRVSIVVAPLIAPIVILWCCAMLWLVIAGHVAAEDFRVSQKASRRAVFAWWVIHIGCLVIVACWRTIFDAILSLAAGAQ